MTKLNDDADLLTGPDLKLALNKFWTRKAQTLVADCVAAGGTAELITGSMLNVTPL
jgi:hypothetical protein